MHFNLKENKFLNIKASFKPQILNAWQTYNKQTKQLYLINPSFQAQKCTLQQDTHGTSDVRLQSVLILN